MYKLYILPSGVIICYLLVPSMKGTRKLHWNNPYMKYLGRPGWSPFIWLPVVKRRTPRRRRRRVCLLCPWSRTSLTALTKHGFQENDFSDDRGFKYLLFVPRTLGRESGWWFQIFGIFTSIWGNDPIWRAYFSDGLVQPLCNSFSWGPRNWDEEIYNTEVYQLAPESHGGWKTGSTKRTESYMGKSDP